MQTHRFFIEELFEMIHPKVIMSSRLVGFHKMMLNSERSVINLMATITEKDCRTVHGLNLNRIAKDCLISVDSLSSTVVKQNMKYMRVPEPEEWKIPILKELLEMKNSKEKSLPELEQKELDELIFMIST